MSGTQARLILQRLADAARAAHGIEGVMDLTELNEVNWDLGRISGQLSKARREMLDDRNLRAYLSLEEAMSALSQLRERLAKRQAGALMDTPASGTATSTVAAAPPGEDDYPF